MVMKKEVVRLLRSAEGRSFPKVATDVLLDIKGCFSRSWIYYPGSVLASCRLIDIEARPVFTNEAV